LLPLQQAIVGSVLHLLGRLDVPFVLQKAGEITSQARFQVSIRRKLSLCSIRKMAVDLNSFICKRPFFWNKKLQYVRESFANPTFIFRGDLMLKDFAKSLAQNKLLWRTPGKNFRGVSWWNPGGLCNGQSPHGPLDRQSNL
jgi:hypothetical protein